MFLDGRITLPHQDSHAIIPYYSFNYGDNNSSNDDNSVRIMGTTDNIKTTEEMKTNRYPDMDSPKNHDTEMLAASVIYKDLRILEAISRNRIR